MKERIRVEVVREQLALFICDAIEFSEWKPAAVAETRRDNLLDFLSGNPRGCRPARRLAPLHRWISESRVRFSPGGVDRIREIRLTCEGQFSSWSSAARSSLFDLIRCLSSAPPPSSPQPSANSVQTQIYSQLPTDRPSLSNKRHSSNI